MESTTPEYRIFLARQIQWIKYATVAPYGVILWELIILVEKEVQYIYFDGGQWTLLKCIYIACRYLPPILWPYILWCYVPDHVQEDCVGSVIVLQQMIFMLLQLFPHCVLAIRAYAYTGGRAKIRAILISLLCCYIVLQLWVYLSSRQLETKTFALVGRSGCYRNWESLRPRIGYILLVGTVVDVVSTGLVIQHGIRSLSFDGDLQRMFLRQGLFLFTFMMFANILSLTSFLGQPKPWEPFAFGAVLVTPNLLSCRFILELREARASKAEQDIVLQDFSREMRRYLAEEDAEVEQGPRTINSYS